MPAAMRRPPPPNRRHTSSAEVSAPAGILRLTMSEPRPFGTITLFQAIQYSVNSFFCEIGKELGPGPIIQEMKDYGFYSLPPLETPADERRISGLYIAVVLSILSTAVAVLEKTVLGDLGPVEKIPIGVVMMLLAAGGMSLFVRQVQELLPILTGRARAPWTDRIMVGLVFLGATAIYLLYAIVLLGKLPDVTAPP